MKLKNRIHKYFIGILIAMAATHIVDYIAFKDQIMAVQEQNREILITLQETRYKDSIYWKHISECGFLSKNDFQVGYNGYIQTVYRDGRGR